MSGHLLEQAVRFTHALRGAGVPVPLSGVIDFCRSVQLVGVERREDLFAAGCATLICSTAHLPDYERVFTEFWRATPLRRPPACSGGQPLPRAGTQPPSGESGAEVPAASAASGLAEDAGIPAVDRAQHGLNQAPARKNIASMTVAELEQARRLLAGFAALLALRPGRRYRRAHRRGRLHMRAMLRQNVLLGSDGIRPVYRARRLRRTRLFVLCDVSGSMERHARFLIQFLHALRARLPMLELAVFSTGLTVITDMLERRDPDRSLGMLAAGVPAWSGGTDMGTSLMQFNDRFGAQLATARSFVIVLSDGWDCGDASRLDAELQRLRRGAHRVLWLNPRLADERYEPLCRGMVVARKYIDHLLPAHNIAALASLVPHLRAAWH